jgi:hypothetical protein
MSIKATEVGKIYAYSTLFDMSSNTELELKFTSPTGAVLTLTKSGGRVSAPAVPLTTDVENPDGSISPQQTLDANEYMQITTIATDFTEVGSWTVCGTYTDATPKVFFGDQATFTIDAAC